MRQENNLIKKSVEHAEPTLKEIAENAENPSVRQEAEDNLQLIEPTKSYLAWITKLANAMESGWNYKYFPK